jgi:hypothetical protein
MDFRRALPALLILTAGASTPLPIREAQWITPERRVLMLREDPPTCVALPDDGDALEAVLVGAAAFRAPLLLGGQAARAGLSCHSCHRGGGGNPAFLFPGLSGRPGTADVTSSILSSHRGDGQFNPRPIPDLIRDPPKISRDPAKPGLAAFVRGLIVEEFDGPEPPSAVLSGLASYVRALGAPGCREIPARPVSVRRDLVMADEMVGLAGSAMERGDAATARLLVSSARSVLGAVYERYSGPTLIEQRTMIEALDDRLAAIQSGLGQPRDTPNPRITAWRRAADAAQESLQSAEPRSLYNRDRLAEALRQP